MRFRIRFLIKNKIDEVENVISHSNRHTTSTKWLKLVAMLFEVFHRGGGTTVAEISGQPKVPCLPRPNQNRASPARTISLMFIFPAHSTSFFFFFFSFFSSFFSLVFVVVVVFCLFY